MQRVTDLADPRRCKAPTPMGQCENVAVDGSEYCEAHARPRTGPSPTKRIYMLNKLEARTRLAELADHEDVKSLREEIGLLRMVVEEQWNKINNDTDFQLRWPSVQSAIRDVHKLVKDCHVIEQNLGVLLSRQSILRLGQQICQIIVNRLEGIPNYEQIVDQIVKDIVTTLRSANNEGVTRSVALLPSE
jgi:hypothetical protein